MTSDKIERYKNYSLKRLNKNLYTNEFVTKVVGVTGYSLDEEEKQ